MEKIKHRLYQLTLLLTLGSIALVLASSGRQRELFYIAVYASIIGIIIEYKKITFRPFSIAYPILLIGLLNLGWYFSYEYHNQGINIYSDYLGASKKLILGAILIFYIDRFKGYVADTNFRTALTFATGLGFTLASIYAFWQAYHGMDRVEMATNRATLSAYLYSILSLSFIFMLFLQRRKSVYLLAALLMLVSFGVILLTGTRAAMGLYLVMAAFLALYHFRKLHLKSIVAFVALAAALCAISYKPIIKPKIDQTLAEVTSYQQGVDNTSLGSRFSMWTIGLQNGLAHPFGQSIESRSAWTTEYVKTHPHLAASLIYIDVHLHNELIEKYSLQGIPGVILLFFFFISLIYTAIKRQNTLLLITTLFLALYGLTDVLLLSSEAVIYFMALFALSTRTNMTSE